MSAQLDNVIQKRLHRWLWPMHVAVLVEDTTGWKDLQDTLLHATGGDLNDVVTALDTTLSAMGPDDLDWIWITGDLPQGEGAKNPATFLSTLLQDNHEVDWAWDEDAELT